MTLEFSSSSLFLSDLIYFWFSLLMMCCFSFLQCVLFCLILTMFTNTTKMICWNYGGVSSRDTVSGILYLMKKFNPVILCLVETRANDERLERFCSKLKPKWNWAAIVAEGYSGGIITI